MSSSTSGRQRIVSGADLIRRGAALLGEACPRCGGVQIKYQNMVYCLNEDDLSSVLDPQSEAVQNVPNKPQQSSSNTESGDLRRILEEKLGNVSKQLQSSKDPDEQAKLLELISKYVDTLDKLKKSGV
ncbi:MAG: Sjogren's syndrome/scleroderma autoantigen 1 family protein [Nitrososphaerales archaeon]